MRRPRIFTSDQRILKKYLKAADKLGLTDEQKVRYLKANRKQKKELLRQFKAEDKQAHANESKSRRRKCSERFKRNIGKLIAVSAVLLALGYQYQSINKLEELVRDYKYGKQVMTYKLREEEEGHKETRAHLSEEKERHLQTGKQLQKQTDKRKKLLVNIKELAQSKKALADEKKALADKLADSENSQAWVRRELFQDQQRHKSVLQKINEQKQKAEEKENALTKQMKALAKEKTQEIEALEKQLENDKTDRKGSRTQHQHLENTQRSTIQALEKQLETKKAAHTTEEKKNREQLDKIVKKLMHLQRQRPTAAAMTIQKAQRTHRRRQSVAARTIQKAQRTRQRRQQSAAQRTRRAEYMDRSTRRLRGNVARNEAIQKRLKKNGIASTPRLPMKGTYLSVWNDFNKLSK